MNRRAVLLGSLALPGLVACASVDTEETITLVGVVETYDPRTREVLLRGNAGAQSGALVTMVLSPRVQNADRLRPGDRVTARYYRAIAAQVVRPLAGSNPPSAAMAAERNAAGAPRPGGEMARVISGRVTITAVDPANNSVTFTGPGGIPRTVVARLPEVQSFIRQLRVGEQVDIVYEEALAISVEPMR